MIPIGKQFDESPALNEVIKVAKTFVLEGYGQREIILHLQRELEAFPDANVDWCAVIRKMNGR